MMAQTETSQPNRGLQGAVGVLTEATAGESKTQTELKSSVSTVEDAARREGLEPELIDTLAGVVATWNRDVALCSRIVRCLIPRSSVPCSAVLRILGSLKRQSLSLQLLMIRWILLVYDVIEDRTDLHAVYGVVFFYLQVDELRQVICQLLCYLTRKSDVTHFRVQKLTELVKHVESSKAAESGLTALLILYHSYCPHMVSGVPSRRKRVWFRPFEKQLASNIKRIQQLQSGQSQGAQGSLVADKLQKQLEGAPPPVKRQKRAVSSVPHMHPSTLHERRGVGEGGGGGGEELEGRVSLKEVTSHRDLCDNIGRLEFPSQMASVLRSHHLAHLFSVCGEPSSIVRFTYWLEHSLGYELDEYTAGSETSELRNLLQCLHRLTQFIMEPIPTVESFLHILLEDWNGDDYRPEVLQLLSHLSLQPFEKLENGYLHPLKKLFVSKDKDFKYACLLSLSQLLKNTAVFEWPRHSQRVSADFTDQSQRVTLFSSEMEDQEDFNPLTTIRLFVKYVDHLIVIGLEQESHHVLVYHAAMNFYDVVADLPERYGIPLLSLPPPSTLYCGLLGHSAIFVARACAHILQVKQSLSNLRRSERELQMTQTFNSVVLDFCDALWRNMIFKNTKRSFPTLAFHLSREHLESCSIQQAHKRLSLVHHPAMASFVLKFFRETQDGDTAQLLQPSAIWQETRHKESYLDFLRENSLTGISDFIKTFVRTT